MEGYRTQLVAAATAILSAAAAFGFELTPEQQNAILALISVVVWPVVMIIMRAKTKTPMKIPMSGGKTVGQKAPPQQVGYAHPVLLAILAGIVMLTMGGCQGAGVRAPETPLEGLYLGNKYGEQVTRTVNDLRRNMVISPETHREALDRLQEALDVSRQGRVAYSMGRFSEAMSALDRTEAVLTAVAVLLTPHLPETPENEAFIERYGAVQ